MALKVVFFYQQADRGWTEVYYANSNDPLAWSIANITVANMQPFISWRAGNVNFLEVRASLIGSPRTTYSTYGAVLGTPIAPPQPVGDVEAADCLCLLSAATGVPRHIWVRGVPQNLIQITPTGGSNPPAALLSALTRMATAIINMGMCIQQSQVPSPTVGPWYQVVSVAPGTGTTPSSELSIAPAWNPVPPYPPMYFQGLQTNLMPGFPRRMSPLFVNQVGGNTVVTVPWLYRSNTNPFFPTKLKFTPLSYAYTPINSLTFEVYSSRKTGRPFDVPAGRRKAQITRQ